MVQPQLHTSRSVETAWHRPAHAGCLQQMSLLGLSILLQAPSMGRHYPALRHQQQLHAVPCCATLCSKPPPTCSSGSTFTPVADCPCDMSSALEDLGSSRLPGAIAMTGRAPCRGLDASSAVLGWGRVSMHLQLWKASLMPELPTQAPEQDTTQRKAIQHCMVGPAS